MPLKKFPARWAPPQFESVDRKKDAEADGLELGNATTDLFSIIMGRGNVPEETMQSQSDAIKMLDKLGIKASWNTASSPAPSQLGQVDDSESQDETDSQPETDSDLTA